jgi:hypothetical protein
MLPCGLLEQSVPCPRQGIDVNAPSPCRVLPSRPEILHCMWCVRLLPHPKTFSCEEYAPAPAHEGFRALGRHHGCLHPDGKRTLWQVAASGSDDGEVLLDVIRPALYKPVAPTEASHLASAVAREGKQQRSARPVPLGPVCFATSGATSGGSISWRLGSGCCPPLHCLVCLCPFCFGSRLAGVALRLQTDTRGARGGRPERRAFPAPCERSDEDRLAQIRAA